LKLEPKAAAPSDTCSRSGCSSIRQRDNVVYWKTNGKINNLTLASLDTAATAAEHAQTFADIVWSNSVRAASFPGAKQIWENPSLFAGTSMIFTVIPGNSSKWNFCTKKRSACREMHVGKLPNSCPAETGNALKNHWSTPRPVKTKPGPVKTKPGLLVLT